MFLLAVLLFALTLIPALGDNRPTPLLVNFTDSEDNSTILLGEEDRLYTLLSKGNDLDGGSDIALMITALKCEDIWVNITNNGDAWGLLSGEDYVQIYGLSSTNYGDNRSVYTRIKFLEGFPEGADITAYLKVYSGSGGFSDWHYMGNIAKTARAGQTPADQTPVEEGEVNGTKPMIPDMRISGLTDGVVREGRRYTFDAYIVDPDGVAGVQQVEIVISFAKDFNITLHYYYGVWSIQEGVLHCRIIDQRSWIDREFKHIQLTMTFLDLPVSERLIFRVKATDLDGLSSDWTTIEEEVRIIGAANESPTQSDLDKDASRRTLGFLIVIFLPLLIILFIFYTFFVRRKRERMDMVPLAQPYSLKQ